MESAIIHGVFLAFSLILPLGVQNVFVFNQGVTQPKFIHALPVIITAACCDTILIGLAVGGISLVVLNYYWIKTTLIFFGGLFMIYMGWNTWNTKVEINDVEGHSSFGIKKQVLFAASVSLLNPHAILDTIGVIGTSSLSYQGLEKVAFSISTIIVSWVWFFFLAILGRTLGKVDKSGFWLILINKTSALIIWSLSIYLISTIFQLPLSYK